MPEILEQHEVDALLAAVETGSLRPAEPVASKPVRANKEVRLYDFRRPERVSKEQMRSLEAIHESFARNLGASLSGFLRTIVEIRVASVEQLTYGEFIHSLPNPTNFNLLTAQPLEGQMCLEISPLIIFPIIDRLLGGSNSELYIPQRPLTVIEQRLVARITDRALSCLSEAWSDLADARFKITETESNPQLVQIVAPNEVVVVLGFEIRIGSRAGTMSLCIPFNVIEPVMGRLMSQGWLAYQRQGGLEDRSPDIARGLAATYVQAVAFLAETSITVGELMTLQPGDILQTPKPSDAEVIVQVEGRNKFAGKIGVHKDHVAVRITRMAEVEERL